MQHSDTSIPKSSRCDGQASRERLLAEALRLFAEHGFAKTSTRAIAQAAGVNISAISYYFGDKEGLYRSAFYEPFAEGNNIQEEVAAILAPDLSLQQALHQFFSRLLTPFAQGTHMQQCLRLHLREMVERAHRPVAGRATPAPAAQIRCHAQPYCTPSGHATGRCGN